MTLLRFLAAVFVLGPALGVLSAVPAKASSLAPMKERSMKKVKKTKEARPHVQKEKSTQVKQKKLREPQKTSDQQLAQGYRTLQSVNKTLKMADHDYGGLRAGASKSVGAAENQLREALKSRGEKAPGGKSAAPQWHPEPQKLSNAQLKAALPVLQQTIAQLKNADHDYGGHRKQAIADLENTKRDLEEALKRVKQ